MSFELLKYDQYLKEQNHLLWITLKHHKTQNNTYIDFIKHSYLKAIFLDKNPYLVIMKSVQSGGSEYLIVRSISHAIVGMKIFYVMPTAEMMRIFVVERFNKSIANTKYYQTIIKMMEDQGKNQSEHVRLKDIGDGAICFVGSFSDVNFLSFAADEVIVDEFQKCNPVNIKKANDRLGHSEYRWIVRISNPEFQDTGIDTEYKESDRKHWAHKHDCGNWIMPDWFKHVVRENDQGNYELLDKEWTLNSNRDINLICDNCNKPFYRFEQGLWISEQKHDHSGYQISKLFSGTVTIKEILNNFQRGLVNDDDMQVFYNSDLGLPYTAQGAKITDEILNSAINGEWQIKKKIDGVFSLAGIDIGNMAHIIIGYVLSNGKLQVTLPVEVDATVKDIVYVLEEYNVAVAVADARPEKFLIRSLKQNYKNIFSCYYTDTNREPVDQYQNVKIDRTASMDEVKEDLVLKNILLPLQARSVPGFYDQMKAPVRVFNKDKDKGQGGYDWIEGSKADHYFHALVYLKTAKKVLASA